MMALAGGGRSKDASGDVLMGAVVGNTAAPSADSLVWGLQAERSRSELEGDWARAATLTDAINSLGKGGKGGPAAWSSPAAWSGGKGG